MLKEIYFYASVYGGSALMVYNIIRYFLFARTMHEMRNYGKMRYLVSLPGIFLILFLVGYILVGIFAEHDPLVASILLGGSIFVFLLLIIIFRIIKNVREQAEQSEVQYKEAEKEILDFARDASSYFRINLTKDIVIAVGGPDLYASDLEAKTYDELLSSRTPHLISTITTSDCPSFRRNDLLRYFALGHDSASEVILVRRDDGQARFVNFRVSMIQEPSTRDVIAFFIEEEYNEKMIFDTVLNRALSYRYDIVCSIIEGKYQLIASGQQECAKAILPSESTGSYSSFCDALVLPRLAEKEGSEKAMESLSLQTVAKELSEASFYEADIQIVQDGQTYYKRFTFYSITPAAEFYVLLVQDTTAIYRERSVQNERLSLALAKAQQANAAKTIFFANMSHDIRTPMNAIMGFTDLALKSKSIDQAHEYLTKIDSSSKHMLSLINDVLEMSRIEAGKVGLHPTKVDLHVLIRELYDLFLVQMSAKGIELSYEEKLTHRNVITDPQSLSRVLMNLLSNAHKFTKAGGKVTIKVSESESSEPGSAHYVFSVKDTGIGMSKEFAEKVFEAYEREKKSTVNEIQGTGLGMAISKSIVTLMNGTIVAQSEEGVGTEFIVELDFKLAENAQEAPEKEEGDIDEDIRFDGMRLLLADDNEINRELARLILEESGFEVEEAENGKEAFEKATSREVGYYDAILMDLQMPIMDGLEASKAIRSFEKKAIANIPIVAFTADAFPEDIAATKEAGMNAHVSKPIQPDQIKKVLQALLKK